MQDTTIAFDLGSTKIDICRMTKDGEIIWRDKLATDDYGPGRPDFLDRALALFASYVTDRDSKVGVSWNAPVHEQKLTQSSLLGGRIEVDLGRRLADLFRREVQVESDVHAMALGEFRFGHGRAAGPFVLVNMGSGAGLAYHDGTLMRGHLGGAGLVCSEPRYVPEIDETVIVDNLLSGRGVSLLYNRLTGRTLKSVEVVERLPADRDARRVFEILATHLGAYLVTLARLFNPRTIILAGSVSLASAHFLPEARAVLESRIEPACRPDAILVSSLQAPACRGLA